MRSFDTDGTDVSGVFDTDRNGHIYIKKYLIPFFFIIFSSHQSSGTLGELMCEKEINIFTEVMSYNAVNVNNHDYLFNTIGVNNHCFARNTYSVAEMLSYTLQCIYSRYEYFKTSLRIFLFTMYTNRIYQQRHHVILIHLCRNSSL